MYKVKGKLLLGAAIALASVSLVGTSYATWVFDGTGDNENFEAENAGGITIEEAVSTTVAGTIVVSETAVNLVLDDDEITLKRGADEAELSAAWNLTEQQVHELELAYESFALTVEISFSTNLANYVVLQGKEAETIDLDGYTAKYTLTGTIGNIEDGSSSGKTRTLSADLPTFVYKSKDASGTMNPTTMDEYNTMKTALEGAKILIKYIVTGTPKSE